MASSANILLLICFCISSMQVYTRESQYFSKVSSYNIDNNADINAEAKAKNGVETELPPTKTNSPKKNEEPKPTTTSETHNGYGLYGHSMDQGASHFTYSTIPEMTPLNEYNAGENSENMFNPYNSNNENNNGDRTKQYGMSDTKYPDNGNNNYGYETQQTSLYGNNGNYNYNKNQYPVQQQGMSDTRFLENGKYFYDLNNEDLYRNRYQTARRRNDVFGSYRSRGGNSREQYYQEGNDENLNKFYMDNNQNGQEEYVP